MPNIFQYKPQLKYVLEDINTIDNISDSDIKVEESYIRNRGSIALESLESNIKRIDSLKSTVDKRLQGISIKYRNRPVDESLNDMVLSLTDGDKYVTEGIISYDLYKDCLNRPLVDSISKEWEKYHTDIEGIIEGELYPYIAIIEEDLNLMKDAIAKTSLRGKKFDNIEALKREELLSLEALIKKRSDRQDAYEEEDIDMTKIKKLEFEIGNKEAEQKMVESVSEIAIKYAKEVSKNIDKIEKLIDKKAQDKKNLLYSEQASKIKDKFNIKKDNLNLIVYQGFRAKREGFYSKKQENSNLYNKKHKRDAQKAFYTNAILYSEVVGPAINEMNAKRVTEDMSPGISIVLEGIEDIINSNESSMLNLKNIVSASNRVVGNHIDEITDKDKARMMYRSLRS